MLSWDGVEYVCVRAGAEFQLAVRVKHYGGPRPMMKPSLLKHR